MCSIIILCQPSFSCAKERIFSLLACSSGMGARAHRQMVFGDSGPAHPTLSVCCDVARDQNITLLDNVDRCLRSMDWKT